ncbi:hypothetical protein DF165_01415 [Burkholderia cenocepacia]|nr:hypothetical protein DF165_01415 [Burkholderia cenocepacia]
MAIEERWPNLVHGRDYWVRHPLDPKTGLQSGDALIDTWNSSIPCPDDITELLKRAEELRPVLAAKKAEQQVRDKRDSLLRASDWTQASDAPPDTRERWAEYRSALRDVPQQAGFPLNVVWPQAPTPQN